LKARTEALVTARKFDGYTGMTKGGSVSAGRAAMRLPCKSWIIIEIMKTKQLPPVHPGEILLEDFMKPRGLSQNALARALHVAPACINEIVPGKRSITAETALRLSRYFGTTAEVWTGLPATHDLRVARYEKARVIEREAVPLAARSSLVWNLRSGPPACLRSPLVFTRKQATMKWIFANHAAWKNLRRFDCSAAGKLSGAKCPGVSRGGAPGG